MKSRRCVGKIIFELCMLALSGIILIPLLMLIFGSFKDAAAAAVYDRFAGRMAFGKLHICIYFRKAGESYFQQFHLFCIWCIGVYDMCHALCFYYGTKVFPRYGGGIYVY